jgi:hypothetical protein
MPAPVVVVKDVGGFVADYQTQTAIYRATGREVRLHECRSACTLALSLPTVCVYKDSTLKFHLAYDPRNHVVNSQVSQQMFDSYPATVQVRLGTLTRAYKVLRGDELIALGVRDCNTPKPDEQKIMIASAGAEMPPRSVEPGTEKPLFASAFDKMLSVFGIGEAASGSAARTVSLPRPAPYVPLGEIPLPPTRPAEFAMVRGPEGSQTQVQVGAEAAAEPPEPVSTPPRPVDAAVPASAFAAARQRSESHLPAIITGAQPILPPNFRAYAEWDQ